VGEADQNRLGILQDGGVPFHEPGLDPYVARGVASGLLTFHASNAEASEGVAAVFLAVPTPAGLDGSADLSAVEAAIRSIAPITTRSTVVVIKSSVPPGSWKQIEAWMTEAGCAGSLAINPEFLQEGKAVEGVLAPTRVVVGSTDPAASDLVARLHEPFGAPVLRTDPSSAELTKYAANAYLAMRVTFANTIANLADGVGADISEVVEGIGFDPRIGSHFLKPGPGYGGSCFPKDLPALIATAAAHGVDLALLQAVVDVNLAQVGVVLDKLIDAVGSLAGKRVALLGLAFKADTDDLAGSPAISLAESLVEAGAEVIAYDPAARASIDGVVQVETVWNALREADAVLVATEWPEFGSLDPAEMASAMRGDVIIDARNMIDKRAALDAGLDYQGMGR
jgi:UDPglucose 6-dehydrogenase